MTKSEITVGLLLGVLGLGGSVVATYLPTQFPEQGQLIFWVGASVIALSVLGLVVLYIRATKGNAMSDGSEMGDDNTAVGDVILPAKMGSRNTFAGPTDANRNTYFPGGTSIGAGAGFDPTSVIIGSGAGANLGRK